MKKVLTISFILVISVSSILKFGEILLFNEQNIKSGEVIPTIVQEVPKTKEIGQKMSSMDIKKEASENKKESLIVRKDKNIEKQKIIDYLWDKTHNIDMILTFERESGLNKDAINWNTNKSFDKGLCQLNSTYHLKFIKSKEFNDIYKQLDYCINIYNNAIERGIIRSTFYAYNVRQSVRDRFVIHQEAYNIYFAFNK